MNKTTKKPPAPRLVKFGDKPHQLVETAFGPMCIPLSSVLGEELATACFHKLPLIPLELFYQVLTWQKEIAAKCQCESHTSLFLIKDKWVAEPFFQKNDKAAMTIKVDYTAKENKRRFDQLCKNAQYGIHATIHNHVNIAASQSNVDEDDERCLPGPHITLGGMQQKTLSFHARFSLMADRSHHFIPMRLADIVELPLPPNATQGQIDLAEKLVLTDVPHVKYPEKWKKLFEEIESVPAYSGHQHQGHPAHAMSPGKHASGTTASDTKSSALASSANKVGNDPMIVKAVKIEEEPWALIMPMDATNYVEFKMSIANGQGQYNKPIAKIMAKHNLSIHEMWKALNAVKAFHGIPLDSIAQATTQ